MTIKKMALSDIRQAVADYMESEGCTCCRNTDAHKEAENRLGKLLKLPITKNWSGKGLHGYDFSKYRTKK